jgi:hypothetical protein
VTVTFLDLKLESAESLSQTKKALPNYGGAFDFCRENKKPTGWVG